MRRESPAHPPALVNTVLPNIGCLSQPVLRENDNQVGSSTEAMTATKDKFSQKTGISTMSSMPSQQKIAASLSSLQPH